MCKTKASILLIFTGLLIGTERPNGREESVNIRRAIQTAGMGNLWGHQLQSYFQAVRRGRPVGKHPYITAILGPFMKDACLWFIRLWLYCIKRPTDAYRHIRCKTAFTGITKWIKRTTYFLDLTPRQYWILISNSYLIINAATNDSIDRLAPFRTYHFTEAIINVNWYIPRDPEWKATTLTSGMCCLLATCWPWLNIPKLLLPSSSALSVQITTSLFMCYGNRAQRWAKDLLPNRQALTVKRNGCVSSSGCLSLLQV